MRRMTIVVVLIGGTFCTGGCFDFEEKSGPQVGDCARKVKDANKDKVEQVACSDPRAEFRVVARKEEGSAISTDLCDDYSSATEAYSEYTFGHGGFTICLAKK